jgi:hypothetical protein
VRPFAALVIGRKAVSPRPDQAALARRAGAGRSPLRSESLAGGFHLGGGLCSPRASFWLGWEAFALGFCAFALRTSRLDLFCPLAINGSNRVLVSAGILRVVARGLALESARER